MTINHSELLSVVPGGASTQHHVDGDSHDYLTSTDEGERVGTTLNGTLSEHATAIDGLKDGTLIEDNAIKANHITNASVSLAKINPAGASEGQVLGFSGGAISWNSLPGSDFYPVAHWPGQGFVLRKGWGIAFGSPEGVQFQWGPVVGFNGFVNGYSIYVVREGLFSFSTLVNYNVGSGYQQKDCALQTYLGTSFFGVLILPGDNFYYGYF